MRFLQIALLACLAPMACAGESKEEAQCEGQKCDHLTSPDASTEDAAAEVNRCDDFGAFPDEWISGGPACGSESVFQVHHLNPDTVIIRQSLCTSFEAPFLYLLFGEDKALLEDTGAGGVPVADLIEALIEEREAQTGTDLELIVFNSHAHGDHVAGNAQIAQLADTTVVGFGASQIMAFTGMSMWPDSVAEIDLGGRIVDIFGIPGHEANHIALYDRQHGLLLTGDSFYPGRLFIDDFGDYLVSVNRLVDFAADKDICAILGTHIEMSATPGDEYDFGVSHHPNERQLQLGLEHLIELRDALELMNGVPVRQTHDDFVVFPL